jgi:hypothetical protein
MYFHRNLPTMVILALNPHIMGRRYQHLEVFSVAETRLRKINTMERVSKCIQIGKQNSICFTVYTRWQKERNVF